ncbi:hypothetical protein RP20_CCG022337, partial [Aedes albopictus]
TRREEPLVVIDLLTLIHNLSGPTNEQIYGCRNQFAWDYAAQFCDRMIEAGARLVFFIDGKLQEGKYSHWIVRQEQAYRDYCLRKVETIPNDYRIKFEKSIGGNVVKHAFTSALVTAARTKGELITSYDVECDQAAVASYAKKHDALAIITGDSDFLIFEGNFRIWSSNDLNPQRMSTKEWNRERLRKTFNLEWNQMPFFAAIAGNDLFKCRPRHMHNLNHVGQLVQRLNLRRGYTKITTDLFKQIFGQKDIENKYGFEKAVEFYDTDYTVSKPIVPSEMCHYPNYALSIIRGVPGSIRLPCLDLREADYSQIALQVYRRQVGVLFYHRTVVPEQAVTSPVFVKLNHNDTYNIIETTPITPVKYRLLTWIVSDTLTFEEVCQIDPEYLLDVLNLYFLVEANLLDITTADIILLTIDDCIKKRIPRGIPLQPPTRPNVTTSFLYSNFYALMYFNAETAGLGGKLARTFLCKFDGVYFNTTVDSLRNDADLLASKLEPIASYRVYTKLANREADKPVPISRGETPASDVDEEPPRKIGR